MNSTATERMQSGNGSHDGHVEGMDHDLKVEMRAMGLPEEFDNRNSIREKRKRLREKAGEGVRRVQRAEPRVIQKIESAVGVALEPDDDAMEGIGKGGDKTDDPNEHVQEATLQKARREELPGEETQRAPDREMGQGAHTSAGLETYDTTKLKRLDAVSEAVQGVDMQEDFSGRSALLRTHAVKGQGESATKLRNARKRDSKKLRHLKQTGQLPAEADMGALKRWLELQQPKTEG